MLFGRVKNYKLRGKVFLFVIIGVFLYMRSCDYVKINFVFYL